MAPDQEYKIVLNMAQVSTLTRLERTLPKYATLDVRKILDEAINEKIAQIAKDLDAPKALPG